jgi:hypothetical protein
MLILLVLSMAENVKVDFPACVQAVFVMRRGDPAGKKRRKSYRGMLMGDFGVRHG